jgi:hypothetical protein
MLGTRKLKSPELRDFTYGHVIFEYSIPRMGKRADVTLILNGLVFVLEFKINEKQYKNYDTDQYYDYVLDLKYFMSKVITSKLSQYLLLQMLLILAILLSKMLMASSNP